MKDIINYTRLDFKFGKIVVGIKKNGAIIGLWFENQKYFPTIFDNQWMNKTKNNGIIDKTIDQLKEQLKQYESGELRKFNLQLEPSGTDFQRIVWEALNRIPYGTTISYGNLSKLVASTMGREHMSSQAVGGAIGHNPISIIIPCHRVIGSNGSLTGYAGGIEKKQDLLKHEGAL